MNLENKIDNINNDPNYDINNATNNDIRKEICIIVKTAAHEIIV